MNTPDIRPFEFDGQPVRTITDENGQPWFVLNDVCQILGISNPRMVASRLPLEYVSQADALDGRGINRPHTTVSEPGLYRVVLRSDKPGAETFQRWVETDVLPTIRRTGSYGSQAPAQLTRADLARMILEAETEKEQAQAALAAAEPKVSYHDTFVATDDMISFRTLANQLGIGEQALRQVLIDHRWIYRETHTRWSNARHALVKANQYRAYAEKKPYFTLKAQHDAPRLGGKVQQTLFITPAGATAIARLLDRDQIQTELDVQDGCAA